MKYPYLYMYRDMGNYLSAIIFDVDDTTLRCDIQVEEGEITFSERFYYGYDSPDDLMSAQVGWISPPRSQFFAAITRYYRTGGLYLKT